MGRVICYLIAVFVLLGVPSSYVLAAVPDICSGTSHVLALDSSGQVYAWGSNAYGQLGQGVGSDESTPGMVQGLTGVVAVAAGWDFAMALRDDGTVWTWGYNGNNALGDSSVLNGAFRTRPMQVPGVTNVKAIAAGMQGAWALKHDGTVWAWGHNYYGQLGVGLDRSALWSTPIPTQVIGLSEVEAIWSTGYGWGIVARKNDGTAWGWGALTSSPSSASSTKPEAYPQLDDLTNLWGGGWGQGFFAKPDGSIFQHDFGTGTPVPVGNGVGAQSLVNGGQKSSALTMADGSLWLWDSFSAVHGFLNLRLDTALNGASSLTAGTHGEYLLALNNDGSVWAKGVNTHGQLGSGDYRDSSDWKQVVRLDQVKQIAAGYRFSVGLRSDGTVWTWGANGYGQLGRDSSLTTSSVPMKLTSLANIEKISCGADSSYALATDGTLWAWGRNMHGQLGDGTKVDRTEPVRVGGGLVGVVSLSAGVFNAAVATNDGSVWVWGYHMRVRKPTETYAEGFVTTVPQKVAGISSVIAVAAGYYCTLAIKEDGTVWGWGSNENGQLGDGTTIDRQTPEQVSGLTSVVALQAGWQMVRALTAAGTLWRWGTVQQASSSGQVTTNQILAPSAWPKEILGRIQMIPTSYMSSNMTFAVNDRSELISWTEEGSVVKSVYVVSSSVKSFSGNAFIKIDGTVWTSGFNSYGQIGDGTYSNRNIPVLVVNPTLDGFLDLDPATPNTIPAEAIPPFLVRTQKSGDASALTLSVDIHGLLNGASTTVTRAASGGYNVYVAAAVPKNNQLTILHMDERRNWSAVLPSALSSMSVFLRGVTLNSKDNQVRADILQSLNLTDYLGTIFFVGYGEDPDEMLRNRRYWDVLTVQ